MGNPAVASGVVVAGSASLIRSVREGVARKIANAHGAVLPLVPTLCKATWFRNFRAALPCCDRLSEPTRLSLNFLSSS